MRKTSHTVAGSRPPRLPLLAVYALVLGVGACLPGIGACGSLAFGADTPILVATPADVYRDFPSVVPTGDGYTMVWAVCFGSPSCPGPDQSEMALARLDLQGQRVAPDVSLDPGPIETLFGIQIVRTKDGYLLFGRDDAAFVFSLRLDATGHPIGSATRIVDSIELYPISVASSPMGVVMTYPEWTATWRNYSQPIGGDGLPAGNRFPIAEKPISLSNPFDDTFLFDSPLARDGNAFVTAWGDKGYGVRLRELASDGRPRGELVSIDEPAGCWQPAWITATGGVQAVAYVRGCAQGDIYLRTRDHGGKLSAPIPLSAEPYDEGHDPCFSYPRPLEIAGLHDRVGLVWHAQPDPVGCGRWFFAEYDLAGRRLGPRRDLLAEFGLQVVDGGIFLTADPDNGRYLLTWHGEGPSGYGVYLLPIQKAP